MKFKKGDKVQHIDDPETYGIITEVINPVDLGWEFDYKAKWYTISTDKYINELTYSEGSLKRSTQLHRKHFIEDILGEDII
jgi:hypothetical protein